MTNCGMDLNKNNKRMNYTGTKILHERMSFITSLTWAKFSKSTKSTQQLKACENWG